MIEMIAPAMHASRLFGVGSPAAAMAIMLKGHELGFQQAASMELIRTVEGRPTLSPRGMLALLFNAPHVIAEVKINHLTGSKGEHVGHECTIRRVNGFEYTARFTLDDAKRAGLVKPNSNWEKYPERMTLWRAVDFAADVAAPDVTNGMNTAAKYDDDGAIDAEWFDAADTAEDGPGVIPTDSGPDETAAAALAAQALVNDYGAEAVLAANGGAIPVTLEEVDAARYALIAAQAAQEEPAQ
jgi:hypothetical protein